MFRQQNATFGSETSSEADGHAFNIVAECMACSTLLLRYLLCLGPRPARSRSVETADLYRAPSPSASSGSHSGQAEASATSARSLQREDQPLLKGGEGADQTSSSGAQQGQEMQGFSKAALAYKEGLELSLPDEECCPTCLEPYCPDNPAIETKCRHSFHLACIYEWLERSKTCPVCSRNLEFDELL